jgi:hypothetical protein
MAFQGFLTIVPTTKNTTTTDYSFIFRADTCLSVRPLARGAQPERTNNQFSYTPPFSLMAGDGTNPVLPTKDNAITNKNIYF